MTALPAMLLVILLLGALVAVLRRGRQARRQNYPLGSWWGDDSWRFLGITPEPLPWALVVADIACGFVLTQVVVVVALGVERSLSIGLACAAVGVLVGLGWHRMAEFLHDYHRRLQRRPFAVRPGAIRLPDGAVVPLERIRSIRQRNTAERRGLGPRSAASRPEGPWRRLKDVSYVLEMDYDGGTATLAGGMTQSMAEALAAEVATLSRPRG